MSLAWAFFKRDAIIALSYRTSFAVQLAGNLVVLAVFYYIGQMVGSRDLPALAAYGGNFLAFLLIGIALNDCVTVSLRTFADQIREGQLTGSLETMLMSPVRLPAVLIYSSLWGYFFSAIRFVVCLGLGVLFYDVGMRQANIGAAVAIFALTVLCFAGVGMLWASVVMLIKRGESIMTAIGALMILLSGVLFPTAVLPTGLQRVAAFVPMTPALEGMRLALLRGDGISDLAAIVVRLVAFAVVFLAGGIAAFSLSVRIVKQTGSLTQY